MTYDYESDPWRAKHVVNIVALVEAPVEADFLYLVPLKVVVIADQGVHVAVQALQVVDR